MLYGIDISHYQKDIDLAKVKVDFAIVKATGGCEYVNPTCDKHIQQAIKKKIKWGFYHFAGDNCGGSAENECDFFIANTKGYQGNGIPVLDWEETQSVAWVNTFVRRYHDKTGVWPWIYANPWRFNQGGVERKCARWIADYPNLYRPTFEQVKDMGCNETDGLIAAWQFCSDGRLSGYGNDLDLNIAYLTKDAWDKYVGLSAANNQIVEKPTEKQSIIVENDKYKVEIREK